MSTITDEGPALELQNQDAPAESPAVERTLIELSAADVIDPGQSYHLSSIERRLAIPAERFQKAIRALDPRSCRHQTVDETFVFWGRDVLAIIEKGKVPYEVTDYAAALYRRRVERELGVPRELPPGLLTQVDEALTRIDEASARQAAAAEEAAREKKNRSWSEYVTILRRANTPADKDCQRLMELMVTLERSLDQVTNDVSAIETGQEMFERWLGNRSVGYEKSTQAAALTTFARQRPHLFDTSTSPPHLRGQEQRPTK